MTRHPLISGTIVAGVDGSPEIEHAATWPADEARLENRGLTLVHAEEVLSAGEAPWYARVGVPRRQIEKQIRRHTVVGSLHGAPRSPYGEQGGTTLLSRVRHDADGAVTRLDRPRRDTRSA